MASDPNNQPAPDNDRGITAWFVNNPVAANLLMGFLLVGGALSMPQVRQEVFPQATLNFITVAVPYPGATPQEVEDGIILAVEEALRGVEGVKEIRSTASEGRGSVTAELYRDTPTNRARNDIESAVNRITSFPEDAEEPVFNQPSNRSQVLSLILHGDYDLPTLRRVGQEARRDLLKDDRVAQVQVTGIPPPEISIEVEESVLRKYGLTRGELARLVDAASVELPAGSLETPTGEYLLRIMERRDIGQEFRDVAVLAGPDGTRVTLGELAEIRDTFRETNRRSYLNDEPAVRLKVFRTRDRSPMETSAAVRDYLEQAEAEWPERLEAVVWNDNSRIFRDRIRLLVENGRLGVILVLCVLGLFLRPKLAFWVTLGLPVSFLGVFLFFPFLDVSINMISLFAFLLVLGIVVDDAIVVGEASFHHLSAGAEPRPAALAGAREVRTPVVFAVLTTVVAFLPLMFVPGVTGEFFQTIPLIVIPILLLSLVESLWVLPAHLGHMKISKREPGAGRGPLAWLGARQQSFSRGLEHFIGRRFEPWVRIAIRWRYVTLAAGLAVLLTAVGMVGGGRIAFRFLPEIESDLVSATIELTSGAPVEVTEQVADRVYAGLEAVRRDLEADPVEHSFTEIGTGSTTDTGPGPNLRGAASSNLANVSASLIPAGERNISASNIVDLWKEEIGELPGVERISFRYSAGPGAGADLTYELAHENLDRLEAAASRLAGRLGDLRGVYEIDDGFDRGKPQVELRLKSGARALGISEIELARQVRAAFFGAEALRTQRGKDEVRIYVRRPEAERELLNDLYALVLRTPGGGEIPLREAAEVGFSRSYTTVEREQGERVIDVTGNIDRSQTTAGKITARVVDTIIPELQQEFDGLGFELSGAQQDRRESLSSLGRGMFLALLVMYCMMAVVFKSYAQPFLVMFAIPFGFVGALVGHLLLGFDLNLISLFGLVALSGVVVNDSLVLVAAVNDRAADGAGPLDAAVSGATRRFRPVLLTSLTTFFGLAPMIFETSLQARFLIPMALSLGFGVLFVTVIALVIVPSLYMIFDDLKRILHRAQPDPAASHSAAG